MEELRLVFEIDGFDRVLYGDTAKWDGLSLSVIDKGKGLLEAWSGNVDNAEQVKDELIKLREKAQRFILAVEWAYGHELDYKITKVFVPSVIKDEGLLEIKEKLSVYDQVEISVAPRKVPELAPQVPLQAARWIQIWVESKKLGEYVEEQLRRQYLIIEELWQDAHHIFDAAKIEEKRKVKLIRDFVSHAKCSNQDIVSLIENDLPSSIQLENGKKYASFSRTVEHRNYISRFEVKSREIARALVDHKMQQLGVVNGV